jgi:hypothetical protein
MANEITTFTDTAEPEWFKNMVGDCQAIITEGEFTSRFALVDCYHQLGKRILEENDNFERAKIYGKDIVSKVAVSVGKSDRTIWYALQFAKKYPDLDKLPGGKSVSWRAVVNKYLPDSERSKKDQEYHEHEWEQRTVCKKCGLVRNNE